MTRVKICGITRPLDAEAAVELGAWAIGLNHWSGSPRRVAPDAAAALGGGG
jgi:phosphoribosylanthranilate isomerase